MYFMGIDGGGSNLRVVITDEQLEIIAEAFSGSVNPSLIGHNASKALIQETIRNAIQNSDATIQSVGIGVAGASKAVAETWLIEVVGEVLPQAHVVPASDNEIALVGATGKREGLLLLAGTGSGGFAINVQGEALQIGGWGYLLGDEGSGYWIGLQALKHITKAIDITRDDSPMVRRIQDQYNFVTSRDVINWVYHEDSLPVPRIAKLAPLVLEAAQQQDDLALEIVTVGTDYFVDIVSTLKTRLAIPNPQIVFAGSLLTTENVFNMMLQTRLGLTSQPQVLYPPKIGAALLAKLDYEMQGSKL